MDYRERRYTARDGLSLYYRDYGDALSPRAPVLCLAGLTRDARDFEGFASRTAADRRVLCPDLRGRGRSDHDPNWRNYEPRTYIDDIAQLLTLANMHRVVVVGTSLGGLLAMGLGAARPTALAGVILNDIGPEVAPASLAAIIDYLRIDRPQPDWETAKESLHATLPDLCFQTEAMYDAMLANTFREGGDGMLHFDWDVDIVRPMIETGARIPDLWPLFRGLRAVPTLALRGEKSTLLTASCFARMGREHPGLIRATVRDTGHAPTLNEPECVAALDRFLDDL